MKFPFLFLLFLSISGLSFGQQPSASFDFENATEETPLYTVAEKMPEPRGGLPALYKVIAENMQYPAEVQKRGIQGKVFVRFVVTAQGKIESVEVLKGLDPALDMEAVRIIKLSEQQPGWTPGQEQGENVDVQLVQPVWFKLDAAPVEKIDEQKNEARLESSESNSDNSLAVVYNQPQQMPVPKEGWEAFHSLLRDNLKYPEQSLLAQVQGTVYLEYIIDNAGRLKAVSIKKGINDELNEEALRQLVVADKRIGWLPGSVDGEAVNARVVLMIHFFLNNNNRPFYKGSIHVSPEEADRLIAFEKLPVSEEVNGVPVYHKPEQYAVPEGGVGILNQFFTMNLAYPDVAKGEIPKGEVVIRFIVSAEGIAGSEEILKGVHPAMDAEAMRVMRRFNEENNWIPAVYGDEKVASYLEVPVNYNYSHQRTEAHPIEKIVRGEYVRNNNSRLDLFETPDIEATPKEGMMSFYEFLYKHIQYPVQALKSGKDGITYVRFIIDEEGNVQDAHTMEGRWIGYGLDEEAVRVVSLTKWNPAVLDGKFIKQCKIIPIKFKLQKGKEKKAG
ncbi:TonB family protein [Cesiribacter sp. SM1]|uniref:TonB family protein n=1 Tax=Cesiribacter sp. SM1 TaxID=2861196 RepID=UPI001CD5E8EC|nr:TonB family protein [Cesiribacter sp. SM1]